MSGHEHRIHCGSIAVVAIAAWACGGSMPPTAEAPPEEKTVPLVLPEPEPERLLGVEVIELENGEVEIRQRKASCFVTTRRVSSRFYQRTRKWGRLGVEASLSVPIAGFDAKYREGFVLDVEVDNDEVLRAELEGDCGDRVIGEVFVGRVRKFEHGALKLDAEVSAPLVAARTTFEREAESRLAAKEPLAWGFRVVDGSVPGDTLRLSMSQRVPDGHDFPVDVAAGRQLWLMGFVRDAQGQHRVVLPRGPEGLSVEAGRTRLPGLRAGSLPHDSEPAPQARPAETLLVYGFTERAEYERWRPRLGAEEPAAVDAFVRALDEALEEIPPSRHAKDAFRYELYRSLVPPRPDLSVPELARIEVLDPPREEVPGGKSLAHVDVAAERKLDAERRAQASFDEARAAVADPKKQGDAEKLFCELAGSDAPDRFRRLAARLCRELGHRALLHRVNQRLMADLALAEGNVSGALQRAAWCAASSELAGYELSRKGDKAVQEAIDKVTTGCARMRDYVARRQALLSDMRLKWSQKLGPLMGLETTAVEQKLAWVEEFLDHYRPLGDHFELAAASSILATLRGGRQPRWEDLAAAMPRPSDPTEDMIPIDPAGSCDRGPRNCRAAIWIDRHPVPVHRYLAYLRANCRAWPPPPGERCGLPPEGAPSWTRDWGRANHPVNLVSAVDARHYCESIGKRLPSEQEWSLARQTSSQLDRGAATDRWNLPVCDGEPDIAGNPTFCGLNDADHEWTGVSSGNPSQDTIFRCAYAPPYVPGFGIEPMPAERCAPLPTRYAVYSADASDDATSRTAVLLRHFEPAVLRQLESLLGHGSRLWHWHPRRLAFLVDAEGGTVPGFSFGYESRDAWRSGGGGGYTEVRIAGPEGKPLIVRAGGAGEPAEWSELPCEAKAIARQLSRALERLRDHNHHYEPDLAERRPDAPLKSTFRPGGRP